MISEQIASCGIVPVVRIERAEDAVPLAEALWAGGIRVVEFTFRTEAAGEAMRRSAEKLPDMLVGAGTVRSVAQFEEAMDAGARFVVTPGFNRKVVETAVRDHVPIYPGIVTPGELERVLEYGIKTVKFFPAEASGGTAMLKAFAGPYGDVKFIPTGGIGPKNLEEYLGLGNVLAVGGTWLTKSDESGTLDFALIQQRAAEAIEIIAALR